MISTTPVDDTGLREWSFSHMAHHRDILQAIYLQGGGSLSEYPLDFVDPDEMEATLYNHQTMHNQMDAVLGIPGNDLLDVQFDKKEQRSAWIWLNFQEHLQANQILGV